MKVTKRQLRDIISEQLRDLTCEAGESVGPQTSGSSDRMQLKLSIILQHELGGEFSPESIEYVADPSVKNTYAVRFMKEYDFLVNTSTGDVDEVEYSSWPPRSGKSNMMTMQSF